MTALQLVVVGAGGALLQRALLQRAVTALPRLVEGAERSEPCCSEPCCSEPWPRCSWGGWERGEPCCSEP